MNPTKIILFVAGVFVFTKAAQYFMVVKALLNLRFKKADGEIKQPNNMGRMRYYCPIVFERTG
jgi:hypothetical protein